MTVPATDLVAARDVQLRRRSAGEITAPELRTVLVDLHDFWLAAKCAGLGVGPVSGFALVAVGGYGRRELAPYSDLDLVLLHDNRTDEDVARVADGLWYPLWDARIALDHSVRTVPQAMQVARGDMSAAMAMLDARHIAGEETLTTMLISGVRQQWRNELRGRFDELTELARTRWRRAGDIAHRAEPDLKHGRGGLRDVHLLQTLAIAQLSNPSSGDALTRAYDTMLDVRTELHRVAGRARETVRAQDADEIAAALRLGDRFDLSRTLSDAARTIGYQTDVGLRTASNSLPRKPIARLRSSLPLRRPLDEGVVEHAGEVVLARTALPSKDPGLIVRVAAASARTGMPMAAATLQRLADYAPELRRPWPAEALRDLLVLLSAGHHMIAPIEALDRTGLWGRLLPEWGAVRDLPPRDAAHTWTVDRHLVETAAHAGPLATSVSRPDLLVLGALIHDIGKGRGGDHSVVGSQLAEQIGRRLGLWPEDVVTLTRMVRFHLVLPATAARRDVSDPETARAVLDVIGDDPVLLELLHALAEADSRATGPGVWGEWKARLVATLVGHCRDILAGKTPVPDAPPPVPEELAAKARAGGVSVTLATTGDPHSYEVTAIAPDAVGLLSRTAGMLALSGLRVQAATVREVDDIAVDTFIVSPVFGDPPAQQLLTQRLISGLADGAAMKKALAEKERQVVVPTAGPPLTADPGAPPPAVPALFAQAPPRVLWPATAPGQEKIHLIEVRAADRTGVLFHVADVIEAAGGDIRWAKVSTLGATVVDVFAVELPDSVNKDALTAAILAAVPQPAPTR